MPFYFRPSHSAIGMGDTRSPRLARSRRPEDESISFPDGESSEVLHILSLMLLCVRK